MAKTDSFKQQGMRNRMVNALKEKGISDGAVLEAMRAVPRHWFVDTALEEMAYEDQALPILCEQTISQPSTVAFQTQLLNVKPDQKVLEIGTGSGYQTAVLCTIGAKVWTIERQKGLFDKTKRLLEEGRYRAKCYLGDGYKGITDPDYGQFDRILITCGASMVPEELMDQLKVGGIMVIPVSIQGEQQMLRITKTNEDPIDFEIERFGHCEFVPMLSGRQF